MKAIAFHRHGGPEVLEYTDVPEPEPGPGEALVEMRAAALNHLDIWVRGGWPGLKLAMPHIGGADGAGVVRALGPGAAGVEVGQRVAICPGFATAEDEFTQRGEPSLSPSYHILGEHRPGTFASFLCVPAHALLPMPEGASFADTAAAQLVFLTAWRLLVHQGAIRPGETVLLVGTGGVSMAALQIARLVGASVFVLTRSPEKGERARQLGADQIVATTDEWPRQVRRLTDRRGVDIVVDNVGRATFQQSLEALCRGGRLLSVGNTSGPKAEIDLRYLFSKQLRIIGSTLGSLQDFRQVMPLVWSGKLRPVIDRVLPLAQGRQGYALLEEGKVFGKVVLEP